MCLRSFHAPWRSSQWRLENNSAEQTTGHNSVTHPEVPGTVWDALGHLRHLHRALRSDPGSTGDSCFSGLVVKGQVGYSKGIPSDPKCLGLCRRQESLVDQNYSFDHPQLICPHIAVLCSFWFSVVIEIHLGLADMTQCWWDTFWTIRWRPGSMAWGIQCEGKWVRFCCLYSF